MSEKTLVVFLKNSTPYVAGDVTRLPAEEAEAKCKAGIVAIEVDEIPEGAELIEDSEEAEEVGEVSEGTGQEPAEEAEAKPKKSKKK